MSSRPIDRAVSVWVAALLGLLGAACDSPSESPDASTGGDAGVAVNPFTPDELEDAVEALEAALGEQPGAGDVRLAMVANRHSAFWTSTQIGTQRAAQRLGCVAQFTATTDGLPEQQAAIIDGLVADRFTGIGVSVIDPTSLEPHLAAAVEGGASVITFDSDALAGSVRSLYLGTINYNAGRIAGEAMLEALAGQGGEVLAFAGLETAANAQERVQGIRDVFEGTNVQLVDVRYDNIDFAVARTNVAEALDAHPDAVGVMGIYAYNGPIAVGVIEERGVTGTLKVVSFDTDPGTLAGLAAGTVHAAIGQRPYWFGYLGATILFAMDRLGEAATLEILEPFLDDGIFDSGVDVITPATLEQYYQYLDSLGIPSS